jgi:hypothetical protein
MLIVFWSLPQSEDIDYGVKERARKKIATMNKILDLRAHLVDLPDHVVILCVNSLNVIIPSCYS